MATATGRSARRSGRSGRSDPLRAARLRALLFLAVLAGLAGSGCAASGPRIDASKLVPKDYRGCVAGGGRLDHADRGGACRLQISERRDPTAFVYCLSIGGREQARGSVAGLRTTAGGTRGRVCTLRYEKGPSRQRLDANTD